MGIFDFVRRGERNQQAAQQDMQEQPELMGRGSMGAPAGVPQLDKPADMERVDVMAGAKKIGKDEVAKAEQLLRKYRAGKQSVESRIIYAQEWWKLNNWQMIRGSYGVQGSNPQTKTNTGWLWNCIVGKHADLIDAYPEPVILPRAMDDKEEAQRLSEIVPVVMQANDFEEVYNDCCWQKLQEGTAAYGVFWDSRKNGLGDVTIKRINMLNQYWEPGVTDIQDSANVFLVTLADMETLEAQYPELKDKLRNNGSEVRRYRYDDNVDTDNKTMLVDWYYKKQQNERTVLHYVKFCNGVVLYASENEPELAERGWYDDANYPFVLDPLYPVEGQPSGYGMVDIAAGTQKDIDTLSQAIVANTAMAATPRYFSRVEGGINEEEFADWTKPIVHTNSNLGADSIAQINVNPVSGNIISVLQQKIDEIKFVTGNTDINNGGTPAGVTAASAIAALKEDAGRTSKDTNKAAYRAYKKIVCMVIERIRQFYDLPRQFRILGKRGEEKFVTYSNAGLQAQSMGVVPGTDEEAYRLPVMDIEVRAQRENAYTKMAQNELALQFYGQGFFNPQLTDQALMALDMMEFRGKEELCDKIAQNGTLQQKLAQMSQLALQMAQQFAPEMADGIAQLIMGGAAPAMGAQSGGGSNGVAALKGADETANAEKESQESTRMKNMRARVENASRVD